MDGRLDAGTDWPLVMIATDGELETVIMKPGDMVLFESSRVIHGRPAVLQGDYYVNSFFYFIPLDGWDTAQISARLSGGGLEGRGQAYYRRENDEL